MNYISDWQLNRDIVYSWFKISTYYFGLVRGDLVYLVYCFHQIAMKIFHMTSLDVLSSGCRKYDS